MTRQVIVEPEAEEELAQAVAWYDQRGEGVGDRLLDEVRGVIASIADQPGMFALVPHVDEALGARRALCRRIPYAVTLLQVEETIDIVAFAHLSRRPGYWRDRLR